MLKYNPISKSYVCLFQLHLSFACIFYFLMGYHNCFLNTLAKKCFSLTNWEKDKYIQYLNTGRKAIKGIYIFS